MFWNLANVMITGGSFVSVEGQRRGLNLLRQHMSVGAVHDSGERFAPPKCHPNTRVGLLSKVLSWTENASSSTSCIWFYGAAGAGKTAIGQTLAELLQKRKRLAASYFFCRTAPLRNNANSLIATIAYQIALAFPTTRAHIETVMDTDPSIFERSLRTQLQKLVVDALKLIPSSSTETNILPKIVIIDGLDECHDTEMQCYIIKVILDALPKLSPHLRFFIASRPEKHLRVAFGQKDYATLVYKLDLTSDVDAFEDIRLFLEEAFKEIKSTHSLRSFIPTSWPGTHLIESLVIKSSGQFIYASTVVKYIKSTRRRPVDRLDIILGLKPRPLSDPPFTELDALYSHILSSVEDIESLLRILGVLLIPKRWYDVQGLGCDATPSLIEKLLILKPGDVHIILEDISSLVMVDEKSESIQILHASFLDFLSDPVRSVQFFIDLPYVHSNLARGFIHCVKNWTSSTRSRFGQDFYFQPLLAHCSSAAPTKELYNDMLRINLFTVYDQFKHKYSRVDGRVRLEKDFPHLWHWVPAFFQCLQHSKAFRDFPIVYKRHANLFDEYLQSQISKYYVDDRLVDLLTLLTCFPEIPSTDESLPYYKRASTFILPDEVQHPLWMIDRGGLNIGILLFECGQQGLSNMPREKRRYLALLSRFLQDKRRSNRFYVDGEKYAWAALRCLECIIQPSYIPNSSDASLSSNDEANPQQPTTEYVQYTQLLLSKASPLEVLADFLTESSFFDRLRESGFINTALVSLSQQVDTYLEAAAKHYVLRSNSLDESSLMSRMSLDNIDTDSAPYIEERRSFDSKNSALLGLSADLAEVEDTAAIEYSDTPLDLAATSLQPSHRAGEGRIASANIYDGFVAWLKNSQS